MRHTSNITVYKNPSLNLTYHSSRSQYTRYVIKLDDKIGRYMYIEEDGIVNVKIDFVDHFLEIEHESKVQFSGKHNTTVGQVSFYPYLNCIPNV